MLPGVRIGVEDADREDLAQEHADQAVGEGAAVDAVGGRAAADELADVGGVDQLLGHDPAARELRVDARDAHAGDVGEGLAPAARR